MYWIFSDEKQMILMSEGKDELEKKTNLLVREYLPGRLQVDLISILPETSEDLSLKVEAEAPVPQGGKDKKAAATEGEVKEGKSDVVSGACGLGSREEMIYDRELHRTDEDMSVDVFRKWKYCSRGLRCF